MDWARSPGILLRAFLGYTTSVTDHLPVFAQFDFRTSTSIDDMREIASSISIDAFYPNPTYGPLSISLSLPGPGKVDVEVVDVTGRVVQILRGGCLFSWRIHARV